jgi:hypothetical protein
MKRNIVSRCIFLVIVLLVCSAAFATDANYSDGFEDASLNPYWQTFILNGTIQAGNASRAHSGSRSALLNPTSPGGQKNLNLFHTLGSASYGKATLWFYDTPSANNYVSFILHGAGRLVIQDWDHSAFYYVTDSGLTGTAPATRTTGWRKLTIFSQPDQLIMMIDDQVQYSGPGGFPFTKVEFEIHGPGVMGPMSFDDFELILGAPTLQLTWPTPADIVYGAPLGAAQLNATANVAGTFSYSPPVGTVLPIGNSQVLSATFTPSSSQYPITSKSVLINVLPLLDVTFADSFETTALDPFWRTFTLNGTINPTESTHSHSGTGSIRLNPTSSSAQKNLNVFHDFPSAIYGEATIWFYDTPAANDYVSFILHGAGRLVIQDWDHSSFFYFTDSGLTGTAAARTTGWRKLSISSQANQLVMKIDDQVRYSGPGGFPFTKVEFEIHGPDSNMSSLWFDDFQLTTAGATNVDVQWNPPADILFGTPLGTNQLNATASVQGTFAYAPPAGTILPVGTGQFLTTTFTPSAPGYSVTTKTTPINVLPDKVEITWENPEDITSGIPLGSAQLNAIANLPGSFSYSPARGALLPVGMARSLTAIFTPASSLYPVITKTVYLNVLPAPVFFDGFESSSLNGYWQTFILNGTIQAGDPSHYHSGLTSLKFNPTSPGGQKNLNLFHDFASPTYGQATVWFYDTPSANNYLSFILRGAGRLVIQDWDHTSFFYVPDSGSSGPALIKRSTSEGWRKLTISSQPDQLVMKIDDLVQYKGPGGTPFDRVEFEIHGPNPMSPMWFDDFEVTTGTQNNVQLSWDSPADMIEGSPLGVAQLNATADVPGSFSYSKPIGTLLPVGNGQVLTVTFTPLDSQYPITTKSVSINVLPATVQIAWDTPADITYGIPLGLVQLSATANLAGSFSYSPPLTTVLPVGNAQALTVSFTPADSRFSFASKTVFINVLAVNNAENFSDGFESAALNAFWQTFTLNGVIVPGNTSQVHSGAASVLLLPTSPSGQKNLNLLHNFATPLYGQATLWFYDTPSANNYVSFILRGAGQLVIQDWDHTHLFFVPAGADAVTTPTQRSAGWHKLTISSQLDSVIMKVDDQIQYTGPGGKPFDRVEFEIHGPSNMSPMWFDDFELVTGNRTNALITWSPPKDIVFGTALGPDQLNATANVQGTFSYSSQIGVILPEGDGHILTVTFTPADPNYPAATKTVPIKVVAANQDTDPIYGGGKFSDSFEGFHLNSFWRTYAINGITTAPDATVSHSGRNSVRLSQSSDGQKNIGIYHAFPEPVYGDVSIWFFDTPEAFDYIGLSLNGAGSLNIDDWDHIQFSFSARDLGVTDYAKTVRKSGWRKLAISAHPDRLTMMIDEKVEYSGPGGVPFDRVEFEIHGPRFLGPVWIDDFQFTLDPALPELPSTSRGNPDPTAYLFWTETYMVGANRFSSIVRCQLNGGSIVRIATNDAASPFGGLAVDPIRGKLYSGDSTNLFSCDFDGRNRVDLLRTTLGRVGDIELDLPNHTIYWTEGISIYRANLDDLARGSVPVVSFGAEGFALDPVSKRVYFANDLNLGQGDDSINVIDIIAGSGPRLVYDLGGPIRTPFDIEWDPAGEVLYWNQVFTSTMFKFDPSHPLEPPIKLFSVPTGIGNGFHYDSVDKTFYISSGGNKILRIDANGAKQEVIVERDLGPASLSGISYIEVVRTTNALDGVRLAPESPAAPQALVRLQGQSVTLFAEAMGTAPLRYQWISPTSETISNATGPLLRLANVQASNAGQYSIVISNDFGAITNTIALTVIASRTSQSFEAIPPTNIVLSALEPGVPATGLRFQWKRNGANIPRATLATYTVRSTTNDTGGGIYSVLVGNYDGAILRDIATIIVNPVILEGGDRLFDRVSFTLPSGVQTSFAGNNLTAHFETNEPAHAGIVGGHSVWYSWKSPADGIADFQTLGSAFDTLLAVYTGSTVADLKVVAANDDDNERSFASGFNVAFFTSRVRFNALKGVEYLIAIDGNSGVVGNFYLTGLFQETTNRIPVLISSSPEYTTVLETSAVQLQVTVQPDTAAFQWYFNGSPLVGAVANTLSLPSVTGSNIGTYIARISSPAGDYTFSEPMHLEIGPFAAVHSFDKLQKRAAVTASRLRAVSFATPLLSVSAGLPLRAIINNMSATTQQGESNLGNSLWFDVVSASAGVMRMESSTPVTASAQIAVSRYNPNDEYSDALHVISGSPFVQFPTTAGARYLVGISTPDGYFGQINLKFSVGAAPAPAQPSYLVPLPIGGPIRLVPPFDANYSTNWTYTWRRNGQVISANYSVDLPGATTADWGSYTVTALNDFGSQTYNLEMVRPLELQMTFRNNTAELSFVGHPGKSVSLSEIELLGNGPDAYPRVIRDLWTQNLVAEPGQIARFKTNWPAASSNAFHMGHYR